MTFKELDKELDRLEVALLEAKTMKEWDTLVHRYNALKLDRCRMTGESISYLSVSITDKQLLNIRK
jgi:hypothetical protein